MTNLDSVLESRERALLTKVHIVKAMVFPIILYSCKSWTMKKAEHQRSDALELWCWRRFLRVPWTARKLILKEINPEYALEGLILKLKLQYFGHLMGRANSLEKTLKAREEGDNRECDGWHRRLNKCEFKQMPGDGEGQRSLVCCSPWGCKESDTT